MLTTTSPRCHHVALTWCLFTLTAMAVFAQEPSPASNASAAAEEAEYVEIIYKGKTIRVPIEEGKAEQAVDLGDSNWRFRISAANEQGDQQGPGNARASSDTGEHAAAGRSSAESSEASSGVLSGMNMVLLSLIVAVVVGVLLHFFVIDPMRRRRPLTAAMKIIHLDQRAQFSKAEELLDQALLAGLRKKDIAQARFFLAYLRSTMAKYEEAATVLTDLEKSGAAIDRAAAYLMLWVRGRLKHHERVERIYAEYRHHLGGYEQADLIVSISYLALARLRWARREINGAMHYFDQVRQLKVLADEIPSHIDDHEVVMGTVALFEKNRDEAVKHFNAAVEAARQQEKPSFAGRLGLALCAWREGEIADIDETLTKLLFEMEKLVEDGSSEMVQTECTHCGRRYQTRASYVHRKVKCKSCRRQFAVKPVDAPDEQPENGDRETTQEQLLSEEAILLRNTRLWHCLSLLALWMGREAESGLPEAERAKLEQRLDLVSRIDANMGDPHLIGGLIEYYFAQSQEERQQGRRRIEEAVERDVHVPEVLQLLDRENKLAQLSEHSLAYFHQLSLDYASNPEVAQERRERFVRNMNRRKAFAELGALNDMPNGESVAPSLENLQGRGKILQRRVSNIVRYRLTDAEADVRDEIQRHLDELYVRTETLTKDTEAFQETELTLMESTGEFLFHDEVPLEEEPAKPQTADDDENG